MMVAKKNKRTEGLLIALANLLMSITLVAGGKAVAQTAPNAPPPIRPGIDANGVDLFRGRITYSATEVSIGQPGAGGMVFSRFHYLGGWRHNFIGTVVSSGTTYTVSIGSSSESFTKSGSTYTSQQGSGSALTFSSNKYTYRSPQGDIAVFNKTTSVVSDLTANEGLIESLTMANGEKWTYFYGTATACVMPGCTSPYLIRRLQGVRNSHGYLIKFTYPVNGSTIDVLDSALWWNFSKVTGINLSVDYCNPGADSCPTFSQTWPNATYGTSGGSTTVTNTIGGVTYYTPAQFGLSSVRFPGSTSDDIVVGYATFGAETRVTSVSVGGQQWTYSYSDIGGDQITSITDPLNRVTTVKYQASFPGVPFWVTTPANEVTTYSYDASGRVSNVGNPDGTNRVYVYDNRGNITSSLFWASGGGSVIVDFSANYDATCPTVRVKCNKPNWTRDAYNNQTDYTYTVSGNVITNTVVKLPAGPNGVRPETRYTFGSLQAYYFKDAAGSLVASGESVRLLTQTSLCRTLTTCTNGADELRTVIGYGNTNVSNNRLPVTVTARNGTNTVNALTTTGYDSVGNVVSVDGPLAGPTDTRVTHYDVLRRVIGQVSPDPDAGGTRSSMASRVTYNDRGLPQTVEAGIVAGQSIVAWSGFLPAQTVSREFDIGGRAVKAILSAGGTAYAASQVSFDAMGRVECTATRMDPSTFGSLPVSACVGTGNGEFGPDRVLHNTFDNADRLIATVSGYGTAEAITIRANTYKPGGRLWTATDGKGNLTTYEHDAFGRLSRVYYPDPAVVGVSSTSDFEEFSYNFRSEVIAARRRSGEVVQFPRDNLGRISIKDLPGTTAEDVYYSYDNQGRVVSALHGSTGGPGIGVVHDGLGRVTSQTVFGRTLGYQLDAAGRRMRLTYPDSYYVIYGYTGADELSTLVDSTGATVASFSYDALGNRTGIGRPANAALTTSSVDAISRLKGLQHDLFDSAFDTTVDLDYNPAGQIVSRDQSNDAAFTWTPAQDSGAISSQVDGRNQLMQFNGTSTSEDANGNLRSGINALTYTFDAEGRLRQGTGPGKAVALDYDPTGMLSKVTVNGVPTEYLYDGPNLVAQYNGSTLLRKFVHGPGMDEPLVWFEGTGTSNRKFLHADERGSVIAASDNSAVATLSVKYSPDGESGPLASPFGYTGQVYIEALELYYYKARMYSPKAGRFLSPDPIGYADGMNLYAYVSGDPVNSVDPWGLAEDALDEVLVTAPWLGQGGGGGGGGSPVSSMNEEYARALLEEVKVTAKKVPQSQQTQRLTQNGECGAGMTPVPLNNAVPADPTIVCMTDKEIASTAKGVVNTSALLAVGGELAAYRSLRAALGPTGNIFGRKALGGSSLFEINGNSALRIGWGWKGTAAEGANWFRISGSLIERLGVESGHIDLFIWIP